MPLLERLSIGIDIGGTKVKAGVVDPDGNVVDRTSRDTPTTTPTEVEDMIADVVRELRGRHTVVGVGIGAAGFVDLTRSTVLFSPHLAWRHEPLRDAIYRRIGLSVVVENDANAAAWAEFRFGAAQREDDLICITLGTGIGGALMMGGLLYRGRHGMAGEFGHMQVVSGGHPCECGNTGCWEQYASGNALRRDGRALVAGGSPEGALLSERAGGDVDNVTGLLVAQSARAGDPACVELLRRTGDWLGVGMAGLAAAFDTGVFVVGGGVSDADELLLGPARDAFRRTLTGRGFRSEARIVRAHLGNEAGLVGAADLARSRRSRSAARRARARERRRAWTTEGAAVSVLGSRRAAE